ncbi:MAG: hypothetical protein NTZ05_16835 [Chloroflexi bacterium]|nr:hypothetical protein [Chloroflexota bacterium]
MVRREKKSVRTERAIHQITDLIQQRYPEAEFRVINRHHSSPGIWLEVYTFKDDALDVIDLTSERLMELLLHDGVDLYVLPLPYDQRPSLKAAADQPSAKSA